MMKLFQKNPAAALAKAREHLAAAEAKAVALRGEREHALLEFEGVDEVAKIDAAIAAQERSAAIHRDRIAVLQGEARQQATEQRETARAAAIATIDGRLKERTAKAIELEAAIARVAELYAAVVAADGESRTAWQPLPMPTYWATDDGIAGDLLGLLHRQTRTAGSGLFPRSMWRELNAVIGVAGVVGVVAGQNEHLLATLRTMPLPGSERETDDEQEAA
jgi:hypothetical protein